MAKVDPFPDSEELEKRRKLDPTKYIISPHDVSPKDDLRARQWAAEVMKRNESKLSYKWKDREVITSGEVEPEAIDVRNIYPFPNLRWLIYRNKQLFDLMLISGEKLLFISSFAKI